MAVADELPGDFRRALTDIVGGQHVLEADAAAGYCVDWTGRFKGRALAVVRPRDTAQVAAVLALCTEAGRPVVPQGGNTGLVGGGVPLHGEVVLSLTRLNELGPVDREACQVTAGAGVTLARVGAADPDLDLGIQIASRDSATVGGAVATNAGGVRVLRYGPMRAQLRGIEAVLSDGTVVSHLAGLIKDNTGYDYPSLLAGSEGTLAVITKARLRLVPRPRDGVTAIIGADSLEELHVLALAAVRQVPGLISAEFFTQVGLDILAAHAGLTPPLPVPSPAYLLLDAAGPGALDDLADLIGDKHAAVGQTDADRRRLWSYRERHPEAAGFLGVPIKLDVSVPAAQWARLAAEAADVIAAADPNARVITFGHVADGNVHVNIVPGRQTPADGRHEDAVFSFVASLGGSISAEHGIGALKARWLGLARTDAERDLFARIRGALDPAGTLNPFVLPRLPTGILTRVTGFDAKADLLDYLQGARGTLLWKLDGLGEYDIRRPLTPTGTNLLGLVKHQAGGEFIYFGDVFGRPHGEKLPWLEDGADESAGMWATPAETRASITGLYRRAWQHANATIAELPLDATATVPWWGGAEVTLGHIMVHMTAETQRHAGHADIVRELVDGSVGLLPGSSNMSSDDPAWWRDYRDEVERAARAAGS